MEPRYEGLYQQDAVVRPMGEDASLLLGAQPTRGGGGGGSGEHGIINYHPHSHSLHAGPHANASMAAAEAAAAGAYGSIGNGGGSGSGAVAGGGGGGGGGGGVQLGPSSSGFVASRDVVTIRAKMGDNFIGFCVYPAQLNTASLLGDLRKHFQTDEEECNLLLAYLLWAVFGLLGVHRWYLKQHTCASFLVWFCTGQLFGAGWLFDGLTLWMTVRKIQNKSRNIHEEKSNWLWEWFFGLADYRPNVFAAYFLFFFFGWAGIHRWYTRYASVSQWIVYLITGQIAFCGLLYDLFYTYQMCQGVRPAHASDTSFCIKAFDGKSTYLPITSNAHLYEAMDVAIRLCDREMRIVIERKSSDLVAFILWFPLGLFGLHSWYLRPQANWGEKLARVFTVNYLALGWIWEGVILTRLVDEANEREVQSLLITSGAHSMWPGYPRSSLLPYSTSFAAAEKYL